MLNKISEVDKAYIAGIVDGEGCIGYYNANPDKEGTPYCHPSINVTNTNKEVIEWLHKITGIGRASEIRFNDGKRRTAYQWQLAKKQQVRQFLEVIRPYLRIKAAQADVLLSLFNQEAGYTKKHGSVSTAVAELRLKTVADLKALKRTA